MCFWKEGAILWTPQCGFTVACNVFHCLLELTHCGCAEMSRPSSEFSGNPETISLLTASRPIPVLLPTAHDMQLVPEEPWPEVPKRGYMQPTASHLAKQRSRKARSSEKRASKSVRTSSRASGESSKMGRNTATPISVGGTFDSAWDMVSPGTDHTPVSHSIVEEWLNDCDTNIKAKDDTVHKPCIKEYNPIPANEQIVSAIEHKCRQPEAPFVEVQRENRNRRGLFGHICSFLLGAGVVTIFNAFTS